MVLVGHRICHLGIYKIVTNYSPEEYFTFPPAILTVPACPGLANTWYYETLNFCQYGEFLKLHILFFFFFKN